jgi:gliding motility-associated-like protein
MRMRILKANCFVIFFTCFFINGFSQISHNQPSRINSGLPPALSDPEQGEKFYRSSFIPGNRTAARMATATAAFPIDACATYTFRMQIGDAAADNHINDLCGSYTGNSYQAGYTTVNGNQQDGLLQQLDINGQVLWSRTLGSSTLNERIQSVKRLPDGTLVMTGTIENGNGTNQHPFVAAADVNGILLWMKSIQTATDYRGVRVLAASDGAIGMVAEDATTMLYGRFDAAGNLAWLKKVQALPKSNTVGVGEEMNWFIVYTGEEAGRRVGGAIVINPVNGNIIRAKQFGGVAVNTDFIFHSMQMVLDRVRITGIFSINNQPYKLFRLQALEATDFENVGLFETFNTPAITFDVTASIASSSWGETIAFTNSNTNNDLYLVKAYGTEESRARIGWAKKFSNIGPYSLAAIDRVLDAGYLVVNNGTATALPFTPVLAIKTDSAGLASTGCEGTDFDIEKINSYSYLPQTISLAPVTMSFSAQPELYSFQPSTINTSFLCKALNCPPMPVEDTCVSTFYREFRSTHFSEMANDLSISANNEVLVTGSMRDDPIQAGSDHAILVSFDSKGKLLARKKIRLGAGTFLGKQYQTADGNILVLGNSAYNGKGYVTIAKYTPALTMLWNRAFEVLTPQASQWQVLESKDGSIFIWYQEGVSAINYYRPRLLKLDGAGNFIWAKGYQPANMSIGYEGSACQDDQFIYTANNSVTGAWHTLVTKIEKATGNVIWANVYMGPGLQTNLYTHIQLWQNRVLLSGTVLVGSNTLTALVPIDKDGNIQSVATFDYNNLYISSAPLVTSNNDLVLSGYVYDNNLPNYPGFISFLRLDANMQVLYSKRIYNDKFAYARNLREAADGGIYETGSFFYSSVYNSDLYLKKYTADGTMGNCISENVTYNRSSINITTAPVNVPTTAATITFTTLPYTEDDYTLQQNNVICSSPAVCLKPVLTGPQQICNSQHIIEYRAQRIPGCTAPVSWITDPAQVKVISTSDTLLKVQFIANGTTRIKAGVFSGCRWLQDSLDVMATVVTPTLDLGADTSICTGNTLPLNAHKGFASYAWQDGSIDSLFTVTQPGKYYVTTTDGCGGLYSDTVYVLAAPPISFDLGPDRDICLNDRITITAPAGFLNYRWSPVYNITSTTAQSTVLFPSTDTMYYVAAEKTPGCFAYDSIRIFVKQPVPVHLGNDTSFCAGNTLVLNAGNNFQQYQWSNGAGTPSIPVTGSGTYSIIATAANSCRSYDTVQVTVFANPVIALSKDSTLCIGNSKVYDAGTGYSQYLWHDGSTSSQYTAQGTGKYWVEVTDQHNCKGSDTAVISRIVLPPTAFLPPDTTICTYARFEIKPGQTYAQYLWSNAAITPSITVQQSGLYWLQVTDRYNCVGRDSIMISPKDCLSGLFVPNAFTPDGDGRNDIFKPVVMGPIVKFEFTIFNRWGQRVFQSTNWQTGWNGSLTGKLQGNGTYIWTCTYQFENEPVKFIKGYVTLVR